MEMIAVLASQNTLRRWYDVKGRKNIHSGKSRKKRVYSSKYALSTIVICGRCGDIFRRVHWNNHGCKSVVWGCASRLDKTAIAKNAGFASQKQRMAKITKFLKEQKSIAQEYDEHIVLKLIEKITVLDERLTIEFKSGMEIDVVL